MKTVKAVSLYYKDEKSDKEYNISLVEKSKDNYSVDFTFGRRNGTLQSGTKTPTPVSLEEAEKIFHELRHSKEKKGYEKPVGIDSDAVKKKD